MQRPHCLLYIAFCPNPIYLFFFVMFCGDNLTSPTVLYNNAIFINATNSSPANPLLPVYAVQILVEFLVVPASSCHI